MPEAIRHPVYINSKGRPERQMTAKALIALGVRPTLIVEDAEHDAYAAANPDCDVIVWPQRLFDEYEKTPGMDPHPTTGVGRNMAFEHSAELGHSHHWIMDDNIRRFSVLNHGKLQVVGSSTPLWWHEQFADRFVNLGGLCLGQTVFQTKTTYQLVHNTRLYCAMLMSNEMMSQSGIRWRRGYNEDTITSIDILKTRYWSTVQSYKVGIWKIGTSRKGRLDGGMTQFYANGGFIRKAAELVRVHPDVARSTIRFNRVHHYCDYKQFTQQLIPRAT
jgi:hypothetical protein